MSKLDHQFQQALAAAKKPTREDRFHQRLRGISKAVGMAFTEMQNVSPYTTVRSSEIERELDNICEMAVRMGAYVTVKSNGGTDDTAHNAGKKIAKKVRKALGYTHP